MTAITAIRSSSGRSPSRACLRQMRARDRRAQHLVQQRQHFLQESVRTSLLRMTEAGHDAHPRRPPPQNARIMPPAVPVCTDKAKPMHAKHLLHHLVRRSAAARSRTHRRGCRRPAATLPGARGRAPRFLPAAWPVGPRRAERVGIYRQAPRFVAAAFGTSAAGGVFVPINPCSRPRRSATSCATARSASRHHRRTPRRARRAGPLPRSAPRGAGGRRRRDHPVPSPCISGRPCSPPGARRAPSSTPTWQRSCTYSGSTGRPGGCCPTAT